MVFAHGSFVFAWFLRISNVSQSILLQSSAFDEDPKYKRSVRIRFCTAKSDIPRVSFAYFLSHAHIFKLTKHSILNTIRV